MSSLAVYATRTVQGMTTVLKNGEVAAAEGCIGAKYGSRIKNGAKDAQQEGER
jgi:hypothetical protein